MVDLFKNRSDSMNSIGKQMKYFKVKHLRFENQKFLQFLRFRSDYRKYMNSRYWASTNFLATLEKATVAASEIKYG